MIKKKEGKEKGKKNTGEGTAYKSAISSRYGVFIIITRGSCDATHDEMVARWMTTQPLRPQIIADIKAPRNDATERTNESSKRTDGRTNLGANVHTCIVEQNASADLVAYLWLRYPVVNKVPLKTKTRRNNEQMYPSLLVHKPV